MPNFSSPYDSEVPSDSLIRAHDKEGNQVEESKLQNNRKINIPKRENSNSSSQNSPFMDFEDNIQKSHYI